MIEDMLSSVAVICAFFIVVASISFIYNWSNMLKASLFALGSIFVVIGGMNRAKNKK